MRILFVLPRIPLPAQDGGSVVMVQTIQSLIQRSHVVDVAALDTSRHPGSAEQLRALVNMTRIRSVDTEIRVASALRSAISPRFPAEFHSSYSASYWVTRFASPPLLNDVLEMVRETEYDVVVCESLFTACYGMAMSNLIGSSAPPWVLHAHNVEHVIQERLAEDPLRSAPQRWYRSLLAKQTALFESAAARDADGVVTLSEIDCAWFRQSIQADSKHVSCVTPGIKIPELQVNPSAPNTIGFLGALDWEPNVDGILWFVSQVLPLVQSVLPSVVFHVGGRGRSALVEELHNGRSIIVHGQVEDATLFMQSQSVNVVPLRSGSGIRIKVLEALAGSCAVVSTSVGCEGIDVQHGEHLLVADDAQAFASACIELLQDRERASNLGDRGRSIVQERYSWDVSGQRLEQLLQDVISVSR